MRIYLICTQCPIEPSKGFTFVPAQLEDSGLYRMTCERGHRSVVCLQQMKFEILFDLGAYAILDGYHREAVSAFSSALERFQEFYLQVHCDRREIPAEIFIAAWKHIANQSERQLGAFLFAYAVEEKALPPLLTESEAGFRNAVIHKGKIPSKDEAVRYGERVAQIVLSVLPTLRSDGDRHVQNAVMRHVGQLADKGRELGAVSGLCESTMISLSRAISEPQPTLRQWMLQLELRRAKMKQASSLSC